MIETSSSTAANTDADSQTRRIGIAVASWLCGILEGISSDSTDMTLAEALDSWLRKQKKNSEILYAGNVVCISCGCSWECLVLSNDTGPIQCPECGSVQKIVPPPKKACNNKPENMEALLKIQKDAGDVVSRIETLNKTIKNHHEQKGNQL
jgi:hypothetical protein